MNKLLAILRSSAKALIALSGLFVLLATAGALIPRSPTSQSADQARHQTIYVVSNAIHSDIALPVDSRLLIKFGFLAEAGFDLAHPGANWIVFGWGSRAFYINTPTWSDLKPGPLLTALTLDRETVMHVMRVGAINSASPQVQAIDLTPSQHDRLLSSIADSFLARGEGSGVKLIEGAGYTPNDAFFPARGWFTALYGCNTWTARMLREAGIYTGIWTPLPVTLLWSLNLHNELE
ncbi:MAG: TIGR02117 family protein [Pseudomonadota bacterium]